MNVEDIRDIRGPKYLMPGWLIPAVVVGIVLLAIAVYYIVGWTRRRRRPRVLAPHELALERLEAIRTLLQPHAAREFSIAVSDIVRSYIEQRFAVTATHRTTEEFLRDLLAGANEGLQRHRAVLAGFLEQCDLVKFAGVSLTPANMAALHAGAVTFVRATAPPPTAAALA